MTAKTRTTKPAASAPAEAPVSPARGSDLAQLAAGAATAPSLPTSGGRGASSPLVPLLKRSRDEGTAFMLPPVPAEKAKSVELALRRAARLLDCGVRIRSTTQADGTVTVAFQHKVKRAAK